MKNICSIFDRDVACRILLQLVDVIVIYDFLCSVTNMYQLVAFLVYYFATFTA